MADDRLAVVGRRGAPGRRVVVVGAVNVDLVIEVPHLPGPGETVVGPSMARHGGGKGANAAVAAARSGAAVSLVAAVGDDDLGAAALDELRAEGVDVRHVAVLAASTGVAFVVVDADGENQICVGAGANAILSAHHVLAALEELLPDAGCVLVSTEIDGAAIEAAVRAARDAGVTCLLNPAPVTDAVRHLVGAGTGVVLTPNAGELRALLGDAGRAAGMAADELAAALQRRSGATVVVTLGVHGVVLADEGGTRMVPALAVQARDTTGAGDTFNGVLATSLADGAAWLDAVRRAVVAASLSVRHLGARTGMPDGAQLAAELAAQPRP